MIHIVAIKSIRDYIDNHPEHASGIEAWVAIVSQCNWSKPQDIVAEFGSKAIDLLGKKDNKANTLSSNRVVFDIKGNHLRVIAKYMFHPFLKDQRLYIKWIGTHKDYDILCGKKLQYEIDMFKSKN